MKDYNMTNNSYLPDIILKINEERKIHQEKVCI